jgi:O-antigen ligase
MPRQLLILAIVLPIAALVGYLLADPMQIESAAGVGIVLAALLLPLALKWHHPMLVLSWNAAVIVFFLPGDPYMWMFMGALSFGFTMLNRFMDPNLRFNHVPSVTWTLLFMALVVFITAKITGGVGMRSFGAGVQGGRKYFYIWFAVIGYFALSSRSIAPKAALWLAGGYFASAITTVMSTLAYLMGPAGWVLYTIFPTDYAMLLVARDFSADPYAAGISRYAGFGVAGLAIAPLFLMRYGMRGLLDWSKPWRMGMLLLVVAASLLGGFRSTLVQFCLLFAIQFFVEGLHKTRLFAAAMGSAVLGLLLLAATASSLPMSIQRSLTLIPMMPVSAAAKADAENSSKWRQEIWRRVTPEIWQHFWVGKGLTASARNYYLETQAYRQGLADEYEMTILTGDYHNGPLTLIIPFGIGGVIAFVAFLVAGLRVLWRNRNQGTGWLPNINRVLLSVYLAKIIFFFVVFGSFATEFFAFTGLVALSISLNGGIATASASVPKAAPKRSTTEPEPSTDVVPGSA